MNGFFLDPPLMPVGQIPLLLIVVIVAAVYDLKYRRIPNWLTASGVVAGLALNTFLFHGWPGLRLSLVGLAVGFGLYFLLYALRAMGAGDVKLMAAVGAVAGAAHWFRIFLITAVLGGVLAIFFSLFKKRLASTFWNVGYILNEILHGRPPYVRREDLSVKSEKALRMPHGAIIALGAIVYLGMAAYYTK